MRPIDINRVRALFASASPRPWSVAHVDHTVQSVNSSKVGTFDTRADAHLAVEAVNSLEVILDAVGPLLDSGR